MFTKNELLIMYPYTKLRENVAHTLFCLQYFNGNR